MITIIGVVALFPTCLNTILSSATVRASEFKKLSRRIQSYIAQGKRKEALKTIGQLRKLGRPLAQLEVGLSLYQMGKKDRGYQVLKQFLLAMDQRAAEKGLTSTEKVERACAALVREKGRQGMDLALKVARALPRPMVCHAFHRFSTIYHRMGMPSSALLLFSKAIKQFAQEKCLYLYFANLAAQLRKPDKLIDVVRQGLARWPKDISLLGFKATHAKMRKKYPEAIAILERIVFSGKASSGRIDELLGLYLKGGISQEIKNRLLKKA